MNFDQILQKLPKKVMKIIINVSASELDSFKNA